MKLDQRTGTILSIVMHAVLLLVCVWLFRNPLTTTIVAAGEGQGSGEGVIEVGTISASQLGFTQPRSVSFLGEEKNTANNELVETEAPKTTPEAEVLPSTKATPKTKEELKATDRPTANQTAQAYAKEPLRGSSTNTNVEVGRSFGSPAPAQYTSGVGVGSGANLGASGVPGGSEYGRRIQMILSRNYNPPVTADVTSPQYVIVQLRIARDGRILSVVNGRVAANYFKRRSTNELVNNAAERAILAAAATGLPPFPNGFLLSAQEAVAEIWFRYPK
mgnify:CR=1 FL=1